MHKLDKLYKQLDQYSDFNKNNNDENFLYNLSNLCITLNYFLNSSGYNFLLSFIFSDNPSWMFGKYNSCSL